MRFIAVIWNPTSATNDVACLIGTRLAAMNTTWVLSVNKLGLQVFCVAESIVAGDIVRIPGDRGVVLGTIFRSGNENPTRVRQIDDDTAQNLSATEGRAIISDYWGSYVMFLRDVSRTRVLVLRGPMGSLPCFYTNVRGATVLFSEVDDWVALNMTAFSINWDCIRAQVAGGDYIGNETGISEFSAIISGECLVLDGERQHRRSLWSASSITSLPVLKSVDDAALLMRRTTQQCVNAWMSCHKNVFLQLSGGLDSSIVFACMLNSPTSRQISCANFWSTGSGDERRYARSMAANRNVELLELRRDHDVDLRLFLKCARTANPVLNFSAFDLEPRLIALARTRAATAIFTGEMGDDIFGHAAAPEVLAQSLQFDGYRAAFWRAAAAYAGLKRISLWRAVGQARKYHAFQRANSYWSYYLYKRFLGITHRNSLATLEALQTYEQMLPRFIHPWFRNVTGMPLGRTMLVWSAILMTSSRTQSPFGGTGASLFVNPLASQPLVEAFCRIPSYFHFTNSENGAVARRAFAADLSGPVMSRGTAKCTPDFWLKELIRRNKAFLREIMLDGVLVRQRLLDPNKVEAALSDEVSDSRIGVAEIIYQLYIESWLGRWAGFTQSVAK